MYRIFIVTFATCLLAISGLAQKKDILQPKPTVLRLIDGNLRQAVNQYKVLMSKLPADRMPKTFYANGDRLETSNTDWWTSGFYPGTLFQLFAFSHDTALLNEAQRRLKLLEKEQYNKGTHDLGFMMYCSFGNGLRLVEAGLMPGPAAAYDSVLLTSARSLSTRFHPTVGCIKSWDSKPWHYPVIIDNMMNLELLFWATHESGDSSFYKIAVTHANTTMKNHYRPDYSSFHVVDYDSVTGDIIAKKTAQGYADSSAWARGQSWGLYGYTMVYRSTHDPKYLEQARHIAQFLLNNPHLPADKIPYWDYNAPNIPNPGQTANPAFAPLPGQATGRPAEGQSSNAQRTGATFQTGPAPLRDASAAAIMASALIELSHYVQPEEAKQYLGVAEEIIVNLSGNNYKAVVGSNGGFLLRHSVGHFPAHTEVDTPLTYADYYFVEAMLRYKELNSRGGHSKD